MRKALSLVAILFVVMSLMACKENKADISSLLEENTIDSFLNSNGEYSGFDGIDTIKKELEFKTDNCLSNIDGKVKGVEAWNDFFNDTSSGINSYLRFIEITDSELISCSDLLYIDKEYYLFTYDSDLSPLGFKYITFKETDSYDFLLSNDENFTYKKLFKLLASSDSSASENIPYKMYVFNLTELRKQE